MRPIAAAMQDHLVAIATGVHQRVGQDRHALEGAFVRTDDPDGTNPFIKNPFFYGVFGVERDYPDNFTVIVQAFAREGEARVIARLLEGGPGVLATGGGAFMREETRSRIRDKAVSIWLKADADIIVPNNRNFTKGLEVVRAYLRGLI